jgi:single-stranded DNA-specific DHH superfamily exonuclease
LIVTADCARLIDEISRARELGVDVIVLDHIGTAGPPTVALINRNVATRHIRNPNCRQVVSPTE